MLAASKIVARSDAVYGGVAIGVTILELALIATNPSLGNLALEFALITQLLISLIVEFLVGHSFTRKWGVARSTIVGYVFKLFSAVFLLAGFWFAAAGGLYSAWACILVSFVSDSFGTGCLKASFRPAYNLLHQVVTGKSADYVQTFKSFLWLRIGIPFTLLFSASVMMGAFSDMYSASAVMAMLFFCRVVQVVLSERDLRSIYAQNIKNKSSSILRLSLTDIARHFRIVRKCPSQMCGYVAGNTFESLVLIYAIGLLYRYKEFLNFPEYLSWLGSSVVAFIVFLVSTMFSGFMLSKIDFKGSSLALSIGCLILTSISAVMVIFSTNDRFGFLAISVFCLTGVVVGLIMTRVTSSEILRNLSGGDDVSFFLIAELLTTLIIIALTILSGAFLDPPRVIVGLGIGLILLMIGYTIAVGRGRLVLDGHSEKLS
jgi:hypothetical protein